MTFIFDIDGTLVEFHTNKWLDGVLDKLEELSYEGHRIILITRRCQTRDKGEVWSRKSTEEKLLPDLDDRNIEYDILWNVQSPRYIIDDRKCQGIQIRQNYTPVTVIDQLQTGI